MPAKQDNPCAALMGKEKDHMIYDKLTITIKWWALRFHHVIPFLSFLWTSLPAWSLVLLVSLLTGLTEVMFSFILKKTKFHFHVFFPNNFAIVCLTFTLCKILPS